jgi:hypothetical protein
MPIINLALHYILIILSIVGYGKIFSYLFFKNRRLDISQSGFFGLFFLIITSYITNFFFEHNYVHNLVILSFGLIFFLPNLRSIKDYSIYIIPIGVFFVLFIGILIQKNHDDFFYYHFGYTLSLVTDKKIIGIGHLEHGFRTPSSIFYLNSLFYLPFVKYYLFNLGAVLFMGFSSIFFIERINMNLKKKEINFILILSLISLIFTLTVFYRIAEHGTDRSALILIFVLIILLIESFEEKNLDDKDKFENYYTQISILLLLIISLKSFYIIYSIFFIYWIFKAQIYYKNFNVYEIFLKKKLSYLLMASLGIFILTVFLNTGCLVYPASFTCLDILEWAIPTEQVENMRKWYSLWSKAGANPNFRVSEPDIYLSNFNWISNWITSYFFTKVSDFLLAIFIICLITFFSIKNSSIKNSQKNNYKFLYIIIGILTIIWFINHPALRYGGYTVIALLFFMPIADILSKYTKYSERVKKNINILIIISFVIFIYKNISRINYEIDKYDYNILENPYYNLADNAFIYQNRISQLKNEKKYNKKSFLVITKFD